MADHHKMLRICACMLLLLVAVVAADKAPNPNAKKVKCKDKSFVNCYKKQLFCPDSCLRTCSVDCTTCQPVCPPPPPPPPVKPNKVKCLDRKFKACYNKHRLCPTSCPLTCQVDCASCQPVCTAPTVPLPPPPPTPTTSPSPPPPSSDISPATAYCKNKKFPQCYRLEHKCPSACPGQCEVDCVTCSPVCDCNKPGAVCQDPRFTGGDGITFYFHGKKDKEYCILTDPNLHINAHFIGKRNEHMKRDFTWVQSLGILFHNHQLYVSALRTAVWDNAVDRLELAFNGKNITLPEAEGATWSSKTTPRVTITRHRDTNAVVVEAEGMFKIKANVVPITQKDSLVHNYGITEEDCFAHLDLGFSFHSLSEGVNGVLGQTYASNYTSRAKMGVEMPVLGGEKEFASSSLFSTDCAVAQFNGRSDSSINVVELSDDLNCASRIGGRGIVCKK